MFSIEREPWYSCAAKCRHLTTRSALVGMILSVLVVATLMGFGCSDDDGGPTPDTSRPAAVVDLSVTAVTDSSATLSWTAPGDDGTSGTASGYDIRYGTEVITEQNWSAADSAANVPAPQAAGSQETFTVGGLASDTPYYFALKTVDESSNWSGLSNVASGTTTGGTQPGDAILVVSPETLDFGSQQIELTFEITNGGEGVLNWTIQDPEESWIADVDPTGGTSTTETDVVTVTVSRTGLAAGAYSGAVTVTPGTDADQDVAISMTVSGPGPEPGEMVLIPAGTFAMGSPPSEPGRHNDETQHEVTLTRSFYLQSTEVTNQQYAALAQWAYDLGHCTATSWSLRDALDGSTQELLDLDGDCEISFSGGIFTVDSGKEDHPVLEVTWYGAAGYCDWLSLEAGHTRAYEHSGDWQCNGHDPYGAEGYRLPTEAEWEYACRAGTQSPFHTGACLDAGSEANYRGTYPYPGCPSGPYVDWTVPVGSYPTNAWDLHDMHGNVWEWCNDAHLTYGGDEIDPVGLWSPGRHRVVRGGCMGNDARDCRSACRGGSNPTSSYGYIGFRPARSAF